MKILDTQTGTIHEYGTDGHDSLHVSQDGRYLTYYNLQNGDGSGVGDYRFVCDDNKVPSESETADAIHAHVFFNIGGWNKSPQGERDELMRERETLRKALMLACEYFEMEDAGLWYEHFLKTAREENDIT